MDNFFKDLSQQIISTSISELISSNKNISIKNIPKNKKGVIFIMNHLNFFEVALLRRHIKFKTVVKSDLFTKHAEVLSNINDEIFYAFDFISYVRDDKESGQKVRGIILDEVKSGENLLIFPEGTSSLDSFNGIKPFKEGIFHLAYDNDITVIPIVMHCLSREVGSDKNSNNDLSKIFFDTCDINIEFLNEVTANGKSYEIFFNTVRKSMEEKLDEMVSS